MLEIRDTTCTLTCLRAVDGVVVAVGDVIVIDVNLDYGHHFLTLTLLCPRIVWSGAEWGRFFFWNTQKNLLGVQKELPHRISWKILNYIRRCGIILIFVWLSFCPIYIKSEIAVTFMRKPILK